MRSKSRLTITLPSELLNRVDNLVDGKDIRNRSHAIETFIRQSLQPTVSKAVIIAGGKSERSQAPALKKIGDRHLFSITLDNLKKYGITDVVVCAGLYEDKIKKIFGDGSNYGVKIRYVSEAKPLGTAGALKQAEKLLKGNPFLVVHGDILTDINLQDLINFHLNEGTIATIALKPRMGEKNYGQAFLHGNKIVEFLEHGTNEGISIVNTGIYILKPSVLANIPEGKRISMEADIFPKLAENGNLSAFIFQGIWYDVSEKAAYREAEKRWLEI